MNKPAIKSAEPAKKNTILRSRKKNELTIMTIEVKPYIAETGYSIPSKQKTEWLRAEINALINQHKEHLIKLDVGTDLFHNHNVVSGHTIVRYPLIQYLYHKDRFYLSGINEGAVALQIILKEFDKPVYCAKNLVIGFSEYNAITTKVSCTKTTTKYRITNYLPFNDRATFQEFKQTHLLSEKIEFLSRKLKGHILKDFAKHLEISLTTISIEILDVDSFHRAFFSLTENKHIHDYQPFDIIFEANVNIPGWVCLGTGKAYGFGLLEKLP